VRIIITTILILFLHHSSNAQRGTLNFQIDGSGNVDCSVTLNLDSVSRNSPEGCYLLLLPFTIDNDSQLKIQDDLIYTFRTISKKYSLVTLLLNSKQHSLRFSVNSINNYLETAEGKSKIEIDLNYKDIPEIISDLKSKQQLFSGFDIIWRTPRKLLDEEVSIYPAAKIKRDSLNSFLVAYKELPISDKTTWFVYPNFKGNSDQHFQFYILLLVGFVTGFAQLNPIIERKSKTVKYQFIIALSVTLLLVILYYTIPNTSNIVLKLVAAPLIPHLVYIFCGILYLKISKRYLWKISGVVRNDANEPMRFANVHLYDVSADLTSSKTKPLKFLYELNEGRFEFAILSTRAKAYKIRLEKPHYHEQIIDIAETRDKSFELAQSVTLMKMTDN
jgi:hypothetical protein